MSKMYSTQGVTFKFPTASTNSGSPLFLRSSGVTGSLNISGDISSIDTVKVVLRGTVGCVLNYDNAAAGFGASSGIILEQTVLNLSDVHLASAARRAVDGTHELPFRFQFTKACHSPKTETSPGEVHCDSSLPSSVAIGSLNSPSRYADRARSAPWSSGRVRYELQAWLFQGDFVRDAVCRDIRLYDSACHAPPPTLIEHFPGEFRLSEQARLRRRLIKRAGELSIEVEEPAAAFAKRGHCVVQATLPVRLKVAAGGSRPDTLDLRIKTKLQASTFLSCVAMSRMPTRKQATAASAVQEVTTSARSFTQTVQTSDNWIQESGAPWWVQDLKVELPLVFDQYPAPTFMSPYIARRYSIAIRIDASGMGRAKFNLKVPIQLLYDDEGAEYNDQALALSTLGPPDGSEAQNSSSDGDLVKFPFPDPGKPPVYVR